MTPPLSLAGRAVFAAACLPPLLTTSAWANSLLTYSRHPALAVAALLAGVALAFAITLTAKVCAGAHRRHLGIAITVAAVAFLLPVAVFSATAALNTAIGVLVCWLVLLAGASVSQQVPDWFTGMRSRAAIVAAHTLGAVVDTVTFGTVAAACTAAANSSSGHLATIVAVVPLLIARAAARHRTIAGAVFDNALLLDIVWVDGPPAAAAEPGRTIRATCPVPPRDGDE